MLTYGKSPKGERWHIVGLNGRPICNDYMSIRKTIQILPDGAKVCKTCYNLHNHGYTSTISGPINDIRKILQGVILTPDQAVSLISLVLMRVRK